MEALTQLFINVIKEHAKDVLPKTIIVGKAKNITDATCDVAVDGEADYLGVRLKAVEADLSSYILIKPVDDSYVLIGKVEAGKDEYVVLQCTKVASLKLKVETTEFNVTSAGIEMKKGSSSLKQIIKKIAEAVTPTVASINPTDSTKLAQALAQLENVLI